MRLLILAVILVVVAGLARAEEGWTIVVLGEVQAGQGFTAELPDDLAFALDPTAQAPPNPPGWTIRMWHSARPETDLVWPANPPYRFDNVRYLDTGYGKTPEQLLAWNPREFLFYPEADTADAAADWVRGKQWQGGEQSPERPEARGTGVLTILDSRIGLVGGVPAVVWLRFEARLSVERWATSAQPKLPVR
ncbi:MAG TPA: hypothetical protein VED46_07310 [Alphaproteobacteria bacterium]|nr:hypothetical protein [Alphaproteobacteria bacterium]